MIFRCILILLLLVPGTMVRAEVAQTYTLETASPTGVASKVAVDMILHGTSPTGLWLATGRGVNVTFDDGDSWLAYGTAAGLPSENVSAMFSFGNTLWAATSHEDLLDGQLYSISDGLSYTDDNGLHWHTVDFSENGLNIWRAVGGDRTVYDISGHDDIGFFDAEMTRSDANWLFAAAFAGGLLASQDAGTSWRRIFPTTSDSSQFYLTTEAPSLRNRYFSCVADTSHGDSLFLWAGTASGIFQYVFAPPSHKLYSRALYCIARCDTCSVGDGHRLFLGGKSGVSATGTAGGAVNTRFNADGLAGPRITAMYSLGDYLLVGTADSASGASTGLDISTDFGDSYSPVGLTEVIGADKQISGFTVFGDRLYMAAQTAGLFVSVDSGQNWTGIPLDTLFASPALQAVNAVNYLEDTLYLGTDSGLVELTMDGSGVITTATHYPIVDSDTLGARIIRIRPQVFVDEGTSLTDSTVLWTVNRPMTASGISMVGRRSLVVEGTDSDYVWTSLRRGTRTYDVNFFGDTAFTVGDLGIWFTTRGINPSNFYSARQYVYDSIVVASLDADTVTAMEVYGDTAVFTTSNGFAITTDRGRTPVVNYRIVRANFDTLKADLVINHTYIGSQGTLLGDFIPALGIDYQDSGPAHIWAGCRPATSGYVGISVGMFDDVGNLEWQPVYGDNYAWNFEFKGDSTFAATNGGLIMNTGTIDGTDTQWDTVTFTSDEGEILLAPGTSVYGVRRSGPYLWVGSDDGTIRMDADYLDGQVLFQRVDSTTARDEVYAFPVPFSPVRGQQVDFHFVVDHAGNVTLEVYDFAMNLVARPIDNVYYAAGIYPGGGSQGITWDGLNGKGEKVAIGVYYFRVDLPSGESRWGKLAVIP